jgi:hypothetical protein
MHDKYSYSLKMNEKFQQKEIQMEDIDLYKLPKDILVKLLATIREDVETNLEQKYKQQIQKLKIKEEILEEISDDLDERGIFYNYERCSHENCPHYMIENENDIICQTDNMFSCEGCVEVYYCSTHYSMYLNDNMLCSNCFGSDANPQVEEVIQIRVPETNDKETNDKETNDKETNDKETNDKANDDSSDEYKCEVIALNNNPNTFYAINHGYIIRVREDGSLFILGIVQIDQYTLHEI